MYIRIKSPHKHGTPTYECTNYTLFPPGEHPENSGLKDPAVTILEMESRKNSWTLHLLDNTTIYIMDERMRTIETTIIQFGEAITNGDVIDYEKSRAKKK